MDRHTIILTADKRQEKLIELLDGERISYAWEEEPQEKEVCEKVYVLPIPVTKLDRNPVLKEKLKRELEKMSVREDRVVKVFGGVLGGEWKDFLTTHKIPHWDFMELSEVVDGNGWITAEATLSEVLQMGDYSICGQNVLVTGFGCCGEKIAKLFSSLGANVTVVARRAEVRQQAVRCGYQAISFSDMEKAVADMHTIINTVPSLVVTENCIRRMQKQAIIVDIASRPGGTDFDAAKKYGITAKLALGLPGIYTTTSSAKLLKNAISKYAPTYNEVREDKSWIFQIVI